VCCLHASEREKGDGEIPRKKDTKDRKGETDERWDRDKNAYR